MLVSLACCEGSKHGARAKWAGGDREFGGGWLPNRVRKGTPTLTVKKPPARARAKQHTSNKAGVYAKLCTRCIISSRGAGLCTRHKHIAGICLKNGKF